MRIAKIPYLNSAPFFLGFGGDDVARLAESRARGFELVEMAPARLGELARRGAVDAGLIPAVDFFAIDEGARLQSRGRASEGSGQLPSYERLGDFGIAVRGRVESVILLSEKPLRDLGGARIGVTEESATSVRLLRLLLEVRHGIRPAAYVPGARENVDACLLIGDEALAATAEHAPAPVVLDLAEEWAEWQDLPFVFAVWVVRSDLPALEKARLREMLGDSIDDGAAIEHIAHAYTHGNAHRRALGDAQRVSDYLRRFTYRLGAEEERALALFRQLLADHDIGCT